MPEALEWTVAGTGRLDVWLSGAVETLSRSQAGRAVAEGRVAVNGEPPRKAGHRLHPGDRVTFTPEAVRGPVPVAQDLPLDLVHVDDALVIVNKPPDLVVHPAHGHPDGTLVNGLLYHLGQLGGGPADERPGVVHRLDKDTSGLLVVAREEEAHRVLSAQFKEHTTFRRYLAVVHGPRLDDRGTLDTPYGRHPTQRKRMTSRPPGTATRRARTHWEVLARGEALALLLLALETGRTHQIRVHMADTGHRVVADALYGGRTPSGGGGRIAVELAAARRAPRQALHAVGLGFIHPGTGEAVTWTVAPPEDMAELIVQCFGEASLTEAMARVEASAASWCAQPRGGSGGAPEAVS